jgi:hypothetical protein
MRAFLVALLASAAAITTAQQPPPLPSYAQPTPWPVRHTHIEAEYPMPVPGYWQVKAFSYDFPAMAMKVVGTYGGGAPLLENQTMLSLWLNDTLYIYNGHKAPPTGPDSKSNEALNDYGVLTDCQAIDMGFGMMMPNWMSSYNHTLIGSDMRVTRKWDTNDTAYHSVTWWQKNGAGVGWFHYLADMKTGAGFRMDGPSPFGHVVNEYYAFESVDAFPESTFARPAGIKCNKVSMASLPPHAHHHLQSLLVHAPRRV